jgi:peroxin-3
VVVQLERNERASETFPGDLADIFAQFFQIGEEDVECHVEAISEQEEMVYLTLSWWLLHVGWKDIGERVRRGVEEVFDG